MIRSTEHGFHRPIDVWSAFKRLLPEKNGKTKSERSLSNESEDPQAHLNSASTKQFIKLELNGAQSVDPDRVYPFKHNRRGETLREYIRNEYIRNRSEVVFCVGEHPIGRQYLVERNKDNSRNGSYDSSKPTLTPQT